MYSTKHPTTTTVEAATIKKHVVPELPLHHLLLLLHADAVCPYFPAHFKELAVAVQRTVATFKVTKCPVQELMPDFPLHLSQLVLRFKDIEGLLRVLV
jgi:hypothetical protein